ncbi:hypothetical protein ACIPQA_02645 [Streptomyces sp. NPDC090109]|uniref:hypothetical protein n=1 Tax=Streptomyces sp. NPDC090109 TaxID=3365948 RepID=UPI00380FF46B
MTYRCTESTAPERRILVLAHAVPNFRGDTEWAPDDGFQCLVEDVEHTFHAAWLRTGSGENTDVFLCWSPEGQWLMDVECCLKTRTPAGSSCTIYAGHPGRCEWAYVDPRQVAEQAMADQYLRDLYGRHGAPGARGS